MKSYKFLEEVLYKVKNIENTLKVLNQSQISVEDKVEQISLLEEIRYEIISHDLIKESLADALSMKNNTNSWQLKLIEKMHKSTSAIPVDLVKSLSKAKIECQHLWKLSRSEASNLVNLKERFTDLIKLIREAASIKSEQLKCSKYDSLLADHDSDITEKEIKEIFPKVGKFFSESVGKIIEKQKKNKITSIQKIPTQKQVELGSACLQQMGTQLSGICTSYDHVNLPIEYDESDFCSGLFSLLRHSGYGIYQKYLAQNNISSQITGRVMYETQGLFMEKMIGSSREFTEFIQPHIQEKFAVKGKVGAKATSGENLYLIFNKVNLSSPFKNADEFTLLAHIMLRTKLEQDIINGKLEVKDLHDAWLEGTKHYKIPVKVENEMDTYFQDEYWASGIVGYFPLKIIALIAAAQIFSFINKNHNESLNAIIKGDFSLLISWLSQNVYSAKCGILDLLKNVTGKGLDVESVTYYLSEKHGLSE
ncbi:gluzincin family metallopeptidase [Wolbachia endosymbiont of Folsomia candida]|uniref:carboxypeptidase n=1 Tax=Wolbachia endosymbiont of Folsomia candida TaxID=169402 RepID=UPI000AF282A0|nr:carboxypeptidase [Wolbachia endosymbiont of Folsomia candida]APR98120.1 carboxypeptidase [Wolbachia endosymbiont of Folsomia candida]